jgi:hypothetical protein
MPAVLCWLLSEQKNGELLPGKKGIMLKAEQWAAIVAASEDINGALHSRNPSYKLELGSR